MNYKGFGFVDSSQAKQASHPRLYSQVGEVEEFKNIITHHFDEIEDPRIERTKKHLLNEILTITILAVIAGARGWEDIENYGISKQKWLEEFLTLTHGIPSDDTFRRVIESIEPEQLEKSFHSWIESIAKSVGGEIIAIDGKTVRGSYDRNRKQSALHLVTAWATKQRLVLAQVKVEDKSNEITAIPALLELLDLSGAIITLDAMGTQTSIARQIIENQADYILALKANHPTLFTQVEQWFNTAKKSNFEGIQVSHDKRVEKGHHRLEIREVWTVPISAVGTLYKSEQWEGLSSIVMVVRTRHLWNKTTHQVQFYLTSLKSDASIVGQGIRLHWGIENQAHWTLDVTFDEDKSRIRSGHSPRNFALLRRLALNLLSRECSYQRSIRQKSKRAAMDNNYMLTILDTFNS